jgi:flagellar hook-associated protein 3 FlgL
MSISRVTVGSTSYTGIQNLQAAAARMAKMQDQMSSGKRITAPSDDPVGTVRAMHLRSSLARNETYADSSQDALSWLSAQDTAYSQTVAALQQARTVALRGLNVGVNDSAANQALASEMDTIKSNLINIANTTFDDRPIFGGTTAGSVAYDSSGNYVGDNGTVTREVGQGVVVPVSENGPNVFSSGSSDVFNLVQQAADALRTNPTSLSGLLGQFDSAIAQVSAMQAREGARYQQVEAAQSGLTVQNTAMHTELSGVEDIDLAEMAMKVSTANTNYRAALQTTATISQLSLIDFLR